ncbi:tetratricopeptide repeat-containing sulfotransferase family protein [Frateuria aurantia]
MSVIIERLKPITALDQQAGARFAAAMGAIQRPGEASAAGLLQNLIATEPGILVATANQLLAQGRQQLAASWLDQVLPQRPVEHDTAYVWALTHWKDGQSAAARSILEQLLSRYPTSFAATRLLAETLRAEGRLGEASALLVAFARLGWRDPDLELGLLSFLTDSRRSEEAWACCALWLADDEPGSPVVHAIAAQHGLQLGHFEQARRHAIKAMDAGIDLDIHYLPRVLSMCQRYRQIDDADLALFERSAGQLQQLRARASLQFAWAKALDDLGQFAPAAEHFRQANALASADAARDPTAWLRSARAGMANAAPMATAAVPPSAPVPVFIVGMPRSGSTLLASRLAQHAAVCDRGELPTMDFVRRQLLATLRMGEPRAMAEAAGVYRRHLVQDGVQAGWYLDKEPMNFAHLGLVHALLPDARIIWCRRRERETALSIWMQHFTPGLLDFAYDFHQIRESMDHCSAMMAHWQQQLPAGTVLEVDYEDMVAAPLEVLAEVYQFLGIAGAVVDSERVEGAVGTSSAWQVRQPIHSNSLAKSQHYVALIPELSLFSSDAES